MLVHRLRRWPRIEPVWAVTCSKSVDMISNTSLMSARCGAAPCRHVRDKLRSSRWRHADWVWSRIAPPVNLTVIPLVVDELYLFTLKVSKVWNAIPPPPHNHQIRISVRPRFSKPLQNDIGHWRSDHSHIKNYLNHYKSDLDHWIKSVLYV